MKTNKLIRSILSVLMALVAILTMALPASAKSSDFALIYDNDDEEFCNVIGYKGTVPQTLIIPEQHNGKKVVGILAAVFRGCKTVENVTFKAEYTWVDRAAFADCTNLTTLSGNEIGCTEYSFYNCNQLKSVKCPIAYADDFSFLQCTNLNLVTITGPYICEKAFDGCNKIAKVNVASYTMISFEDDAIDPNSAFFRAQWDYIYLHKDYVTKEKKMTMLNYRSKTVDLMDYFTEDELAGKFSKIVVHDEEFGYETDDQCEGTKVTFNAYCPGKETRLASLLDADGNVIGVLKVEINILSTARDTINEVNCAVLRFINLFI